jgi:hypothetical protein
VKPVAGDVEGLRRGRGVKNRHNSFNRFHKVGPYPPAVVAFVKPFQATVLKTPNHQDTP